MKVFEIAYVSFESTSQFFFKFWNQYSVSANLTLLYFFRSNIIYFVQKKPIKKQIFEFFKCSVQSLMSILNWQVNFFSNFVSFFTIMTQNSPLNFKAHSFPILDKRTLSKSQFLDFRTCSGENLLNSSWHFWKCKLFSLQIFNQC